jgi:DNA-binding PadR family transcriptional regulator
MHGYALAKHIKASSDDLLQIEEGSLYPALQRMRKEGWVESNPGISRQNPPGSYLQTHYGRREAFGQGNIEFRENVQRHHPRAHHGRGLRN